ncbi:MAG: hypothetical protein QNJ44_04520 [Rhodobacter sp.]|nr:hypothetical protein [Rhodobacter sp.]
MRKDRRWVTSVTKEAARIKIQMPWIRGERRAVWIAKRAAAENRRTARA